MTDIPESEQHYLDASRRTAKFALPMLACFCSALRGNAHPMSMKTLPLTRLLPLGLIVLTGTMGAAPYEPGSGWQEFKFSNLGGANFSDEEPFTFTVRADQQPRLTVSDVGPYAGERFAVCSFGTNCFITSPADEGPPATPLSTGTWELAPGEYSLRFQLIQWFTWTPLPILGHFQVEILPAPKHLTISPRNQAGCIGGTAAFRVQAEGADPLSYQWYFNATNLLTGETNSRLSLIDLQTNQAGSYSVTVSNQYGSVTSPTADLQVFDACVGLNLYAGLSITGLVGRTYTLEYVTNLTETNWTTLVTNTLTQPNWLFIDTNSPAEPKKFFRVRLQPSIP